MKFLKLNICWMKDEVMGEGNIIAVLFRKKEWRLFDRKTQLSRITSWERLNQIFESFVLRSFQYRHRDKRKRLFYWFL